MRVVISSIVLALCLASPVHATDRSADVQAIEAIVQQFKTAVIAHDGQALGHLFLQGHDSWLSVADDAAWSKARASKPQAPKIFPSSWKQFAEFIQNTPKSVEERFYNVRIDTNGAVASVWFDFDFLIDGKVTNRGSESWQMVRAEDGWKISSMLYSLGD